MDSLTYRIDQLIVVTNWQKSWYYLPPGFYHVIPALSSKDFALYGLWQGHLVQSCCHAKDSRWFVFFSPFQGLSLLTGGSRKIGYFIRMWDSFIQNYITSIKKKNKGILYIIYFFVSAIFKKKIVHHFKIIKINQTRSNDHSYLYSM